MDLLIYTITLSVPLTILMLIYKIFHRFNVHANKWLFLAPGLLWSLVCLGKYMDSVIAELALMPFFFFFMAYVIAFVLSWKEKEKHVLAIALKVTVVFTTPIYIIFGIISWLFSFLPHY